LARFGGSSNRAIASGGRIGEGRGATASGWEVTAKRIVLVATDLSSGGGVNKVLRDLAVLFSERLHLEVTVVNARSDAAPTYPFPAGITIAQHRRRGIFAYLRVLWGIRRTRPDVVIGPWTQDNLLLTLIFLFSSTRLVLCEHAPWHFHAPATRLLRRLLYPLAWRVLVLNPVELRHYSAYLARVCLLPNPVPVEREARSAPREQLILAIGHLTTLKNFADAVAAMARSGLERDGWSLAIIGAGPESAGLNRQIAMLGLTRTHIHPPTADLGAWYARASLMLVTSRLEVFSLVLAEAMLAGVVPIAYAADGPSFILDEHPDQLVPMGSVDALAERLASCAARHDLDALRPAMTEAITSRFSEAAIAGAWRDLLDER
jgi:glycosyltransferase involved in cell wall biosynthesis